jgi:alpha-tubulin suppressor-like RCC1 family protein
MEAACQRLCQGDTSSLVDIVNCIDARKSHETRRLGSRTLTAVINVLIQEGAELRRTRGQEYGLPGPTAFFAVRVLAQLGIRQTDDGAEVQRALLVLGLQRCRDLCLDAYFGLGRAQRYYVIMFVKLLTALYGCTPQDLLQSETSINTLTGSSEVGNGSPSPPRTASRAEAAGRAAPLQSARSVTVNLTGGTSSHGGNPRSATLPPPSPQPPREAASSPVRPSNIQNRSALLVSIPGASFDMPLRTSRRYRDLPKKPINAPFAVNPLYEDPSGLGAGGDNGDANLLSGSDTPFPLSPEPAPLAHCAVPETTIPAQFPTPVVLFASYYGLGCVPRLPTADDLARLDVWRQEKQQHPPPPRDAQKSIIKTGKGSAESGDTGRELGKMRLVALRSNPTSPEPASALLSFEVLNGHTLAPTNTATVPYQQQCRESSLLHQYLEHGKLLSWGSAAKGALGPQRQRQSQTALAHFSCTTSTLVPPPSSSAKAAAPRSSSATSAQRRGNIGHSTINGPSLATSGKSATLLTSTLTATPGPQGGLDTAAAEVSTHTKRPTPHGTTDYIYLPTPVNTPARVAAIACGLSVTYVVTVDGVLYSCGRSENGQLGIGERGLHYTESGTSRLQRVLLKGDEAITRVAAGAACAVALAGDRALYCWGHNVYGQCLKLPDLSRVLTPVRLKTSMYKVLDICFGQFFGVLLFDDGIMGTWGIASMLGCNVGDKGLEESLAPDQCKCARQVVHLELASACPIAAVRAGPWHALAISRQGEVYTWGVGRDGRLGHGTDTAEVKPRLVEGLRSCFVVDACCASAHTAVLTSTGSVYVFGENADGQLGLRGRSPRRLPTPLPLPCKAVAVSCAREHTCVLLEDGDIVACGSYRTCGIGLGYGTRFCAPVRILTNYVTLALQCGHFHSLAGVVHRRTALMIVGHSTIHEVSRILSVVVRNGVRCAVSGVGFLVVLSENSSLVSIGRGERGQLGIGDCMKPASSDDVTVSPKFTPVLLPRGVVIQHLRCGPDYVVALDQDGAVYGWGSNECQKLCQPSNVDYVYTPLLISGYRQHRIVQVACGGTFLIALTADGNVLAHGEAAYCGLGDSGGLQSLKKPTISTPTAISALHDIVTVAAGRRHAVAMTSSCNIFAWGVGVLGSGVAVAFKPVRVALSQNIRTIGCGVHNSFAITEDGELWVWGVNYYGECGVPPNREAGSLMSSRQPQHQGGEISAIDAARVIQTPILVARQVRDAAFTSQFGLVIFEDGQVRVSGRLRHDGHKYLLPSFHSNPQPRFSVDVNGPVHRRWQSGEAVLPSGVSRGDTAPVSSAEPAALACKNTQEVISLAEGDEDGDEDIDDGSSTHSSVGSGLVPRLLHPSTSTQLPSSTSDMEWAVLAKRATSAIVTEPRRSQPQPTATTVSSATSAREPFDPPYRLSCGEDRLRAGRASNSARTADLPTLSARASPRLPPVRPTSVSPSGKDSVAATGPDRSGVTGTSTGGTVRKLVSPPPAALHVPSTASPVSEERVFALRGSPLPGQDLLLPDAAYAAQEVTENATDRGTPTSDLDGTADAFDHAAPRSPDVSVNRTRNFPEVEDGSPLQPTINNVATKGEAATTAEAGPTHVSPSLLSMPRPPPQGSSQPSTAARSACLTTQAVSKKHKMKSGSSSPVPAAMAPPTTGSAVKVANGTSKHSRRTPTPTTKALHTSSSPLSSEAEENRIFGVRCFAGWEQVCTVIEKHRPLANEVRMAHDGLQVILQ